MSERAAPFYCPYCADEDLRPSEEGPGAWECRSCGRAFRLTFLGILSQGRTGGTPTGGALTDGPPTGGAPTDGALTGGGKP